MKYLRLLRVKHYIKNLLVFVPLFFSGQFLDTGKVLHTLLGMVCFCMASSAVYIFNDICDREKDRNHPEKCKRPIASGAVSVQTARVIAGALLLAALGIPLAFFPPMAAVYLALYLVLNAAYSKGLKNVAILDVCILVSGFVFRILYGGVVADIEISAWLFLTVLAICFFFALGKRRNELMLHGGKQTRSVLSFYTKDFLDKNMYMCMGLANGFYALWAMSQEKAVMIVTVPIVLVITMRYSLVVEGQSEGDPVEVLLKDKMILLLGVLYVAVVAAQLYLH